MTIWIPDLTGRKNAKYLQIVDAIGDAIVDGSLPAGAKLPPQRTMAFELEISLNTVSRAYAEAIHRGYLAGEVGRGTYVRSLENRPAPHETSDLVRKIEGPIDFSVNLPARVLDPQPLANALVALSKSDRLPSCMDYQFGEKLVKHQQAAQVWCDQIDLDLPDSRPLLTNGAFHGITIALMSLMQPGDVLLAEALTLAPLKTLAMHLGLKLIAVEIDEEGLCPTSFAQACETSAAKVLYCMPTNHTPTVATMSENRRKEIAGVARKHDVWILEDDVYGFLPERRPPPLANYAPERSIYISSLSKSIALGLRLGVLFAPTKMSDEFAKTMSMTGGSPPPVISEIASSWIEDGTAFDLVRRQRDICRRRVKMAQQKLGAWNLRSSPGCFHVWLSLPQHLSADSFCSAVAELGVKVLPAEIFALETGKRPPAVRLSLGHEASDERFHKGLSDIADVLSNSRFPIDLPV